MNCRPKCGMCGGGFDGEARLPLLLPACGHTVCRVCLVRLTQHRGYCCPTCRMKQPEEEVSVLQTNHTLLALILKHKEDGGEQKIECNMEPENNQETCMTHKGVRLMYWCFLSNRPACGECIVEDHPINLKKAKKITDFLEEKNREAQCSVVDVITNIENFKKTCKEDNTFTSNINGLSKNIKKVARKLLLSAAVLESQVTNLKDMDEDIKEMEKMTDKIISKAPECPTGIKGIKALQEYIEKVHKLREHVMANIQVPKKDSGVAAEFLDYAKNLSGTLNTQATNLTEQVCQHMMKEMVVEAAVGKSAKLQWENNKFHLYCLREDNNNCTIKKKHNLKWNWFQRLLQEEETTVFLDMCWGRDKGQKFHDKCQGRVYIQLQSGQLNSQQLLELCTGEYTSLLDNNLTSKIVKYCTSAPSKTDRSVVNISQTKIRFPDVSVPLKHLWKIHKFENLNFRLAPTFLEKCLPENEKEKVAGGEGILLGIHHHHQQKEMTDTPNQPTQLRICLFQSGDVVSAYCEKAKETRFWLLTQDGNTETCLNSAYTFTGCLSIGKELLTKAASQGNLVDISITNCGVVIQI